MTRKGPRGATVARQTEITEKLTWKFTGAELRKRLSLPDDAALFVEVPGGGDWSNTDLPIDERTPLFATATTVRTKGNDDEHHG